MAVEIERKFLVKNPDFTLAENVTQIKQGIIFLENDKMLRVRIENTIATLTFKSRHSDTVRSEFEYEIPVEDALELLEKHCIHSIIEKKRHSMQYKGKMWQIDQFEGLNEGLVVAEVELQNESEEVELPTWIDCEVTSDKRFLNSSLAMNPYTRW